MEFEIKDKEGKTHFVLSKFTINGRTFCVTENQNVYEQNKEGQFILFDFGNKEEVVMGETEKILSNLLAPCESEDVEGR